MKPTVLITDPLSPLGLDILHEVADVIYEPSMPVEKILETVPNCDAMLVRSGTTVTADIINACSSRMRIIGRAGVGVDNIDVSAATQKGIIVVNSPDGNTTAAAEHTVTLMMSLARNIAPADQSLKSGEWKRSKFTGVELRDKTLAIVGLGKIGSKVAEMAKAIGMRLFAFDPLASAEKAESLGVTLVNSTDDLWPIADFITLHIPKTPQTTDLISVKTIANMKDGVRIINCSRGGVINEKDLADAIQSGKVAGAALDVFDIEPIASDNPLLSLGDKVLLTPHLGAATEEAQINVAVDVAKQIREVLLGGFAQSAVNLKGLRESRITGLTKQMELASTLGSFLQQFSGFTKPSAINVKVSGKLALDGVEPLILSALSGYLSAFMDNVTLVNARIKAEERDINITETKLTKATGAFSDEITLEVVTGNETLSISGVLQENRVPMITGLNGFRFFLQPYEHLLMTVHHDKPGVVAKISQVLGDNNINISGLILRREDIGGKAIMICGIDESVPSDMVSKILSASEIEKCAYIRL